MENNEIYIDGVKVVLYDCTEDTTSGDNDCYRCKDEPNCYHKQLKRLEQENKELKKENKELKEICTKICYQSHGHTCRIWELKESKYKSTLEEIREIAKDIIENDVYENSDLKAEKILNEINEV